MRKIGDKGDAFVEDVRPFRKRPVHMPLYEGHLHHPIIAFVTVCTKDRKPILDNERVHVVLRSAWAQATQYHVGRYVIMPDHVHLFCSPNVRSPEPVQHWVKYWKRIASVELKDLSPIWQRDCWDLQLRDVESYDEKWTYVIRNPVRKQLVERPEQWPYQGCIHGLIW